MKLRIQGASIRLRLTRQDLQGLETRGCVEEALSIGGARFAYALVVADGIDALAISFREGRMTVSLPAAWFPSWVNTEAVGFEEERVQEDGSTLKIAVEKDFQCLHKAPEALDPEAFPHPERRRPA